MFVLIELHQSDIAVAQSNYHNVAASPIHFWVVSLYTLQLKHIECFIGYFKTHSENMCINMNTYSLNVF
jgi:hypothetical protein